MRNRPFYKLKIYNEYIVTFEGNFGNTSPNLLIIANGGSHRHCLYLTFYFALVRNIYKFVWNHRAQIHISVKGYKKQTEQNETHNTCTFFVHIHVLHVLYMYVQLK